MTTEIQYTSNGGTDGLPTRADAITAHSALYLIGEKNLLDGNFLEFSNEDPGVSAADLQTNQLTTMEAIADLYTAVAALSSSTSTDSDTTTTGGTT
jgi:hypothetical protein